jgi:acetyl-CoA carboxylase biotin carboxyl carrier protein|tara:strand:- start:69 stop:488 length:420 start_codon:yes stop_codon:yes gene_type:complete
MDLRKVKKLIELVEEAGIAELEVTSGDESVRIAMATGQAMASRASASAEAPMVAAQSQASESLVLLKAPMAGTFYRAASPEAAPFVDLGQSVEAGEVVCIIESMKMMHEIRAAQNGTVAMIPVANGTPVSTGEVLFSFS